MSPMSAMPPEPTSPPDPFSPSHFRTDEACARRLDEADPLASLRDEFHIPSDKNGQPVAYLSGNSLGLQPKAARELIEQELDDWASLAGDAHFDAKTPWYSYHEVFRDRGARLVGANPGEVVMMNSLTVNLHLMMVSFYRPTSERHKILVEYPSFPSDTYAVKSQVAHHGYDPADAIITVTPRDGEHVIREEDIEELLERRGGEIALVMLAGVNFFTGQLIDMARVSRAAKRQGCVVGFDLAHAAGNVPMHLHKWGVDFAVWCSYKYLNAGPGAIGGCFVHESHGADLDFPRFAGWWGNEPDKRFLMHLLPDFVPRAGADGWQISNPPILAMAPLRASLELCDRVGMDALREKSLHLIAYMGFLLDERIGDGVEVITPSDPAARGCQWSLLMRERPKERLAALQQAGVVCDFREPNVIRLAPVPMYNSFHDVWRFVEALAGTSPPAKRT